MMSESSPQGTHHPRTPADASAANEIAVTSPRSPAPAIPRGAVVGAGVGPAREEPTFHLRDDGVADARDGAPPNASEGSSPCRWAPQKEAPHAHRVENASRADAHTGVGSLSAFGYCRCTHEAGDSRCDVHPTCEGCGATLTIAYTSDGCDRLCATCYGLAELRSARVVVLQAERWQDWPTLEELLDAM